MSEGRRLVALGAAVLAVVVVVLSLALRPTSGFPGVFPVASSLLPVELGRKGDHAPVLRLTSPDEEPRLVAACLVRHGWRARAIGGGIQVSAPFGPNQDSFQRMNRDFQTCLDQYPVDPMLERGSATSG